MAAVRGTHKRTNTSSDQCVGLLVNTTTMRERSRRASQQPEFSSLSVVECSDLKNKETSALSVRHSCLCIMREHTQSRSSSGVELECFVAKKTRRVARRCVSSRPEQSLSSGLYVQTALGAATDIAVVDVCLKVLSVKTYLRNHTSEKNNDRCTNSAKGACFDYARIMISFSATRLSYESSGAEPAWDSSSRRRTLQ